MWIMSPEIKNINEETEIIGQLKLSNLKNRKKKKNNDYKLTGHKRPMEHHIAYQDTYSSCMGK